MKQTIFLAGASGVIGCRLVPLLLSAGYRVVGSTRSAERAAALTAAGVQAAIVDVFDAEALQAAVMQAQPDVILHQLTDLPGQLDPANMDAALARNARIRQQGTANLVQAALAAGCPRMVAQSIGWAYAAGTPPMQESDPLDSQAVGQRAVTVGGVISLEHQVLHTAGLAGCILRYGRLYGPGASATKPAASPLHVDAAAYAALLALQGQAAGIYNIAEDDGSLDCSRARRELGWSPDLRLAAAEVTG